MLSLRIPLLPVRNLIAAERATLQIPLGRSLRADGVEEWLFRREGVGMIDEPILVLHRTNEPGRWQAGPRFTGACLELGDGPAAGFLRATFFKAGRRQDTAELILLGGPFGISSHEEWRGDLVDREGPFSRTRGAVGEAAFRRHEALNVVVVSAGRGASAVGTLLGRSHVRSLVFVDPDVVEEHNVSESLSIEREDVGCPKAEALARRLGHLTTTCGIVGSVLSVSALAAFKSCDLIVCWADSPEARLAAAVLAALYLRPLLDIGVSINGNEMGGDVRLIVPGECCLLCRGGLNRDEEARSRFLDGQLPDRTQWNRLRTGSLLSLNTLAASVACRKLEEFLGGVSAGWVDWIRFDLRPEMTFTAIPGAPASGATCTLCRASGMGDSGLGRLTSILRDGSRPSGAA